MSVFNFHVKPQSGGRTIDRIAYVPGTFINAELDKATRNNETQFGW